jgi:hypothetical protein
LTAVQFGRVDQPNTLLLAEIPGDVRESVGDRVELISLILDPNNTIVDGKRVELDGRDFGDGRVYEYSTAILAPARYEIRSVIRNLDDGRAAVGSCSIDLVSPTPDGPVIFPPLFLVRGEASRYLNMASPGQGSGAPGPSISEIFPFPAKEYVPLVGELEPGRSELFATLRCFWGEERRSQGERELAARIASEGSEDWEPVEMKLLAFVSHDAADFYLLEFVLPVLAPGRYKLEIAAEDPATGTVIRAAGRFSVRK